MIGADTNIVKPISTSICTCWTSLVSRVMSDGAPKCCTSRAEKVPTRRKIAARRSRPKDIAVRAANHTAATAHSAWSDRDGEHHRAALDDVGGVAEHDALVDDLGVEAGQVEHRQGAEELERDDGGDRALVRREVGADEPEEHQSTFVSRPSRTVVTISSAVRIRPSERWGWLPEKVSSRVTWTSCADRDAELVGVRGEQVGHDPGGLLAGGGAWLRRGRRADHADRGHQREDPAEPVLEQGDQVGDEGPQRLVRVDAAQVLEEGLDVEGVVERRLDEVVLGLEDPEDRALRDAGGLGDLPGGDGAAVLEQQGQGDVDERACGGRRRTWRWHGVSPGSLSE